MKIKKKLDGLYLKYNRRKYVHPDPLEFLYGYPDIRDREIAGFIASSLAYGKVAGILKSVSCVLDRMGPSPYSYIRGSSLASLSMDCRGFRHRFAGDEDLAALLTGLKNLIEEYGSLYDCFLQGMNESDETVLNGLKIFTGKLISLCRGNPGHLIPLVEKGSACKRLNLFLRWMVRKGDVDPGGWNGIPPAMLIVPLDVHMHRICRMIGFTDRNQADMKTALQITSRFRKMDPLDPVKYDFTLTRFGIRPDMNTGDILKTIF